jgi:hypothetical protein
MNNIFVTSIKEIKHILFLLVVFVFTRVFISNYFPGYSLLPQGMFQAGLFIASFLNSLVIYFVVFKIVSKSYALWASLIYIISPWIFYYEFMGSKYILYLFIFLALYYLSLYKRIFKVLMLFLVIYLVSQFTKRNLFFSDIGIVNAVNVFRGEAQIEGYGIISKIIENRYIYYVFTLFIKTLGITDPLIYFSGQARSLPFMHTPPLWLGLLPMFILGLWQIFRKGKDMAILLMGVIPGVLYINMYNFEKLLLLVPFIVISTVLGINEFNQSKSLLSKILFYFCIALVILQVFVFIPDLMFKEALRFQSLK